jgi:hypothetical protein
MPTAMTPTEVGTATIPTVMGGGPDNAGPPTGDGGGNHPDGDEPPSPASLKDRCVLDEPADPGGDGGAWAFGRVQGPSPDPTRYEVFFAVGSVTVHYTWAQLRLVLLPTDFRLTSTAMLTKVWGKIKITFDAIGAFLRGVPDGSDVAGAALSNPTLLSAVFNYSPRTTAHPWTYHNLKKRFDILAKLLHPDKTTGFHRRFKYACTKVSMFMKWVKDT